MTRSKRHWYALLFLATALVAAMVYPFSRGAAHRDQEQTQGLPLRELPNYDALAASTTRATARAKQNSLQASEAPQTEGGQRTQYEPHFGVPTFLWASDSGHGPALSLAAIESQTSTKTVGTGVEAIARGHLSAYAAQYGLSADDVANAQLVSIHDTGKGPIIVKFKQQVGGIDVFRDEVVIIMNRDLQLIAISGYLTAGGAAPVSSFNLASTEAITKAITDVTGRPVSSAALASADNNAAGSKYQSFTAGADQTSGIVPGDVIRSKQVMYHLVDGYVPSYYIETNLKVAVTDPSIADLSGNPATDWVTQAYAYVISAVDGQILFRKNLVQNDSFTYRVWADPVTKIPYDSPAGNEVIPKINNTPDAVQYPFAAANDITLQNYPFSRNDPWLAPGANETVGNNVDAYVDLFNPDGRNPPASPADPATGDFRAQITAPGQFLHTQAADADPATAEARQAGIQQLFYDVNFLHDWFYEAGFDEASGNAQVSNFGRGGVENDAIRAEAQDLSGRNSSNTVTFADGTSPRMQMLLFNPNVITYVDVLSPDAAAGRRLTGTATFGAQSFDSTNELFQPNPAGGCTAASFTGATGKFVLVDREPVSGGGACSIGTKLNNAMGAGAAGFILVNLSSQPDSIVFITGSLPSFTIPFLSISFNSAATIKTELAVPNTVAVRMRRDPGFSRDSAIDNQLVFHEWAHYLTGRLIGNGSGMVTNQSEGMGEGWSDFNALLLTARADDALTPSNSTFNGVYPVGAYVGSGGDNNGYYFGIRRYPYSTDMTKNPLTLKHIQDAEALPVGPPRNSNQNLPINASNAEAHNTGEVWASMLWECYASLLRDTQGPTPRLTFQEAQTRMKYYLVAALKMTPINPTFLEGRDALLVAAYTTDPVDYDRFWHAFAKRGAGFGAVAPDRYSGDNIGVTESFSVASDAEFTGATVDDSVTPCDHDGVLDTGETGKVTISLRNTGLTTLTATTGTLTTTTPGVSFPNGGDVTFASFDPQSAATASANVALASGLTGAQSLDFQFSYNDPQFGGPHNVSFHLRGNTNLIPSSTATDTVEQESPPWTATSVPVTQTLSGVTQVVSAPNPFQRKTLDALEHIWHVDDIGTYCDERLTSPVFTVDTSGLFNVQFDHFWKFEFDGGGNYDGAVVEMSVNGGAFSDIGGPAYNGTILNGGSSDPNPLRGRNGFVKNSPGIVQTSLTQAIAPGSTVQIRFREGCDISVGATGWDINNIAFTGVVETPFATLVADPGNCPAPTPPPVTLDLSPQSLPAGNVNSAYATTSLTASGGAAPYTYTVTPFGLPPGMVHDLVAGSLQISGTPTTVGTFPLAVVVKDNAGHQQTFNYSIVIDKADPNVVWNNPADITYPESLSATQLNASASVPGTFTYTPVSGTVLNAGSAQSLSVTFVPADSATYATVVKNVTINVLKGTPAITWNNPADITYGTPLSGTQLNATASVPGTFTYTPQAGTVLNAGNGQTLSVNFVPTDTANYNNSSQNASINVLKATPTITWNNPADIVYGTALGATQLDATASVPGVLTYTPPAATVLNAGNGQTLAVNFVPTDTANYNNASQNVSINVLKATPVITWSNPADIVFGTALGATQLNATASVPGVLTYTPPATTVLNAGDGQTLSVSFAPMDTANYNNASQNVSINVLKATPVITWNNPTDIVYGTALDATQLDATASVPGVLTYTPPAGTVLNAGNGQTLSVNFAPTDTANYNNASQNVSINVLKATPVITWNNPADIVYGTALGATQLNAAASVPGVLTYTPPAGTVLNAGNSQTLSVNFVPTDTANYNFGRTDTDNASQNVSINVLKATPTVTWNNPADIVYGTALSATQLNAVASVPGLLTYTPPATTVLNAGNGQTLSVSFVPSDSTNYNNASQNVSINVLKATPVITWSNPADIIYGTALGATQLNATTSAPGVLTYTPPAGTVLNIGNGQDLSVNFAPTDTGNYNNASKNVSINVLKATPVITWSNPADIVFGTALGATQLNATANVPGVLTYTPPAATVLNAGNGQTLSVSFVPNDAANYNNASLNVSINVLKATTTIAWTNPADIVYGTALGATQLNALASVPGVLTYTPPAGTVLNTGNGQNLSVNFVPSDSTNYSNASKNVSINVLKATPAISWNNPADINYGTALGVTQLNAAANVPGTFFYTPSSGAVLNAGSGQTLSVDFVPTDTANYSNASKNVSINVLKATPNITWSNPADIAYGSALSATQLNATASVPGVLTYTPPAATVLNTGNGQTLSVSFVPADTTNYNNASQNVSINVLKATPTIAWNNPADIIYGTALGATQLNAVASVAGVLTYTPPATTVLNAGNGQTLSVSFVPADTTNYNNASQNVSINVLKATPAVTWNNPADITYLTTLSGTQLNASANVAGAFTYTPPANTLLNAGNSQTLSVNFVPADTTNYHNASKNVSINVAKATPVIAWNNPADITYATALGATQFNATGSVPGAFIYTPPAGTVLNSGSGQTLSLNFVPTDTGNYNNTGKDVSINVLKANQTITFAALTDKPLGSSPIGVTGNSTSGLPLSFALQSGPATISNGTVTINGIGSVTLRASQAGDANYNAATPVDQSFTVTKASTSAALSSSLNPSTLSQSVTLTATITSAVTPTGTVTFKDGPATLGTGALNSSGVATLTTSTLALGLHSITADYAGDSNCLPSSGTLTGGQLVNSPANGVIQFAAASYSVSEAAGSVAITVTRSGDLSLPASIDYATNDGSSPGVFVPCSLVTGAALDRCDFGRAVGTLQFTAGQSSRTFTVLISNDSLIEGVETVQLVLSNASAGSQLGSQTTATLSIIDDDVVISGNLVDNATAFVEQLYHDFLNRQADSAGLAFWTAQITSCGSDQSCLGQARVNVAASFFLSIEFSETGFLVERLYKTTYGSGSGSSTAGSLHSLPVPIIRFGEFLLDRRKVAEGVVVGQSGWPALLENNKVAFVNEFVLRPRFTTAYPASMTAATFVDALNANAGSPLSSAERNQMVSDLGGGTKSRAQVLRAIAENPNTVSAEFNRAFVLMQYFGFLRRNPNDAPDTDYTGFDFWLTKLNQFNGNYLDAEMVKAFITSMEYRQRFGN